MLRQIIHSEMADLFGSVVAEPLTFGADLGLYSLLRNVLRCNILFEAIKEGADERVA